MTTQTIDQTDSETELHRVLYLLKFLRAMMLHVALSLFAVVLLVLFGLDDVYPLANDLIHAFQAQLVTGTNEWASFGPVGFWIVATVTFLAAVSFIVWTYRSITNVRRWALRFQAVFLVLTALHKMLTSWPQLTFAFQNLSAAFAMLAALGSATVVAFPLAVAIALWRVARVPERSSLLATLDPRLAPNFWVYLNKLLDLPRTPLRTIRTAFSYLLALAGALLTIAAAMYLLTVGGTSNKLALLTLTCDAENMPECVAKSVTWSWQILLGLVLALAGIKAAAFLQSTAKRLGGLGVSDVIRNTAESFILYLRPFDTDDVLLRKPRLPLLSRLFSFTPFPVRIEQELFDVADGYRPLIAIARPGAKNIEGGLAYRAYLSDSEWQSYVAAKIRDAERIVMVLKNTDGVHWEFDRVIGEGAVMKTLFLLDPVVRSTEECEPLNQMILPAFQGARAMPQDFRLKLPLIGFFFQPGRLVQIVNANRTATSYRTAFSHFLAEQPAGSERSG